MKIGVLAMQGAFIEHIKAIEQLGAEAIPVRYSKEIDEIDGLIIPGGESTAIGKLITENNIKEKLQKKITKGLPVWGTCAGMILIAKEIVNSKNNYIPLMDIKVVRNGYGRQLGSFIVHTKINGIEGKEFPMVFIRAPYIEKVGEKVSVLAINDNRIVAAREKNMLVTSFHPELTDDIRIHRYFLDMVEKYLDI